MHSQGTSDEWMDGWMYKWMDGWMVYSIKPPWEPVTNTHMLFLAWLITLKLWGFKQALWRAHMRGGHGLKTKGRETRVPAGGSDCRGLQRTHVTSEESATDRHMHTWQQMTACIWQQKLHFREPCFSWVKTVVCNILFYSLAAFTKDCSQREALVTCVWFNFLELTNTDIWGKVTEGKFEIKCGDTKNTP